MSGAVQPAPWVAMVHHDRGLRLRVEPGRGGPPLARLGERAAVLDGALDNRLELARSVRGMSAGAEDAEVVLATYAERGRGIFPRLRGRFSLVLCDGTSVLALR